MSNELARAKKKYIAYKRAERRLKTRLEDIDWEFDVLLPELAALEQQAIEKLELSQLIVEDED